MIYNFNINPRCGKTYYECNKSWKELKADIKRILDEPQKCREEKVREIICRLEMYRNVYLKEKEEK